MCGILGSVNISFENSTLDLIKHRGPDYGKIIKYTIAGSEVTLGHRRLSIVDLSPTGHQPMNTFDGKFNIIFNGEIYNHLDLRKKLTDINFKGHSDTETILYHLAANGPDGLKDLNGIFALAFVDEEKQKLILARDPFGVKPLYYTIQENRIVFASEIRPIKDLIKTTLSKDSLSELLKLRYNPSENTLFNEIKKLLPGHIIEYDLNTLTYELKPFGSFKTQKKNITLNQALNQYGDLFEKAVKRQLMSDVDLGVLLSGGIDSALVTHFAVKNSTSKIKSFTVGFDDLNDPQNELLDARESAEILGTDHHEIVINQKDFERELEEVVNIIEEPLGTTSSIPMYFLNKEVSKHVKVVLTGQGADEPLGGYPRYLGEIYGERIPRFLTNLLKPLIPAIKHEKLRRFINSSGEKDIIKRFEKTYALFHDHEIYKIINQKESIVYPKINYFYDLIGGKHLKPVEAMMAIDLRMNLSDDLLLYTDKVSMNFGLETRVPILDLELIQFINSLPLNFKINNGNGKFIHKEFAKTVLPENLVNRKKKGFLSPTNKWFNENLGLIIEKIVEDDTSKFNKIFVKKEILNLLKRHREGFNQEKQLFLILSLYFWFKNLDS